MHSKEQRLNYIHNLADSDLPNPSTKLGEAIPLADIFRGESGREQGVSERGGGHSVEPLNEAAGQDTTHESIRPVRHSITRNNLIPENFAPKIPEGRINDIMVELKMIRLKTTPNAIVVLFQTFLELSIDAYIECYPILEVTVDSRLKKKLEAVLTFLEDNEIMSNNELLPVRRSISKDTDLNSVRTLHSFVHNRFHSPGGGDLSAMWNSFAPFFEKIWEAAP